MAVISIRPSQEKLRNVGEVRRPDRMPHFVSPHGMMPADKSIVPKAIGDLAQTIQQSGGRMLAAYLHYKRTEDNILLAKAGAEYQTAMRKEMLGTNGSDGQPATKGLMALKGDDIKRLGNEAKELEKRVFSEVCDSNELDGRMRGLLRMHVNPVKESWENHVASHVFRETERQKLASADANSKASYETWQLSKFDTETAAKALSDFEYLRKQSGDTDEVAGVNVRKFAKGLVTDIIGDMESACASEADFDGHIEKLKDPERRAEFVRANAAIYDELVGKPARNEVDAIAKERKLPKGEADELLESKTKELERSVFSPKTVELLIEQAKQKKNRFVIEQTRQMNAEVDALIAKGGEAEVKAQLGQGDERERALADMDGQIEALKQKGGTLPEGSKVRLAAFQAAAKLDRSADSLAGQQMLTDYLDRLKDDPNYRIYNEKPVKDEKGTVLQKAGVEDAYKGDPRKERLAKDVQDKVDRERMKQSRAQADANADAISEAFNRLLVRKMNGDITQAEAATEQSRIWSRFMECTLGGSIPANFMKSFRGEFGRELDQQQANAMRKLYAAFGYTGELDSSGAIPKSVQNSDTTNYYTPTQDGTKEGGRTEVGAKELFSYGASLLRALETADPKMDREALIESEIKRAKTDWIKRGFFDSKRASATRNANAALRNVMDVQREMKTRWEMARPEKRSEKDDGRREDGDPSK